MNVFSMPTKSTPAHPLIMLLSLQLRCRMTDRFLSLMQKSSLLKLPLSHKIILHGKNRMLGFPDQLNALENKLNDQFFRCHRSIIINLMNVKGSRLKNSTRHYVRWHALSIIHPKKGELRKNSAIVLLVTKNLVHQILAERGRPQHISSSRECASLARSAFFIRKSSWTDYFLTCPRGFIFIQIKSISLRLHSSNL